VYYNKHTFLTFNISCGTCDACVSEGILPWNSASCCAFVRLRPDVVRNDILSITLETATWDQLSLSALGFPGHIFAPCDEGEMRVPGLGQITWPPRPYVPLLINRFQTSGLLIVQQKYLKSCSPHKIQRNCFDYST